MKLKVWENIIVAWVNAFCSPEIIDVFDLKRDNFFIVILDKLQYKGDCSNKDLFYVSDETHPYLTSFIKDIYPEYDVPNNLNSSEDIILIASLILLWFCLKKKDKDELLSRLYSLDNKTQCFIQAYLEKLLYIPSHSITKDLIHSAILSIDDPHSKDSPFTATYGSPSSPCFSRSKQEILSPAIDRYRDELRSLRRDNDLLKSENSYLTGELEQQKDKNIILANEIESKNKDILRLENENFLLMGEASKNRKEKRMSGSSGREKKLKNEISEMENVIVSLRQDINGLTDLRNQLRKKVGDLERENSGWRDRVTDLEEKCFTLEIELNKNETVINQLQQTVSEQREFLSETHHHGNVTVGNDSSILCDDVCSPAVPETLTSVIEVKYNELELKYQSTMYELNQLKISLQDKDKRIYGLMSDINTNSSKINSLEEEVSQHRESVLSKQTLIEKLKLEINSFEKNIKKMEEEKIAYSSQVKQLNDSILKQNSENLRLIDEIHHLNVNVSENNETISKMVTKLSEKDNHLKRANAKLEGFKEIIKEKDVILKTCNDEIRILKDSLNDNNNLLKESNNKYKELEELLVSRNKLIEKVQCDFGSLKEDLICRQKLLERNEIECNNLKETLTIIENVLETNISDNRELKEKLNAINAELVKGEQEMLSLKESHKISKSETEELIKSLSCKEDTLIKTICEVKECKEMLAKSNIDIFNLNKNLREKENTVKEILNENQLLQNNLRENENNLLLIKLESENLQHILNDSNYEIKNLKETLFEKEKCLKKAEVEAYEFKLLLSEKEFILSTFGAEVDSLKHLLSKSDTEIKELKNILEVTNTRAKGLEEALIKTENVLVKTDIETKKLQEMYDKSNDEIKSLREMSNKKEELLKKAETETKELKETLNNVIIEIKRLEKSLVEKQQVLRKSSDVSEELCKELEEKDLLKTTRETEQLKVHLQRVSDDFKITTEQLEKAILDKEYRLREVCDESNKFKTLLDDKVQSLKKYETETVAMRNEIINLNDKLKNESGINKKLLSDKEDMKNFYENKILALTDEIQSLWETVSSLTLAKNNMESQITMLKEERDSLNNLLCLKADTVIGLESTIEIMNSEITDYKSKLDIVNHEKLQFKSHSDDMDGLNVELKAQCNSSNKEVKSCKNKINELEKQLKVINEEKTVLLERLEEFDSTLVKVKTLETDISNLNETISIENLQMKKVVEEKNRLTEELAFKQREIEGMTLQIIDFRKVQETEAKKYLELSTKFDELTILNETHLNDLVVQRKLVQELEADNLGRIYEISTLTESKDKMEKKYKSLNESLQIEKELLNGHMHEMELELKTLKGIKEVYLNDFNRIKNENEKLTIEIVEAKNFINEMNISMNGCNTKVSEFDNELKRVVSEKDKLIDEIKKQRIKEVELNESYAALNLSKIELEKLVKLKDSKFNELNREFQILKMIVTSDGKCQNGVVDDCELCVEAIRSVASQIETKYKSIMHLSNLNSELNDLLHVKQKDISDCNAELKISSDKINDLNDKLEKTSSLVSELNSEKKRMLLKEQSLLSSNNELQECLQEKNKVVSEIGNELLTTNQMLIDQNSEVDMLKVERKTLENNLSSLNLEIVSLKRELSEAVHLNKNLQDEINIQKDLLTNADAKNKELSNRVETLNDLIMQYCITIQENTSYISDLKNKMSVLKESLLGKNEEVNKLKEECKAITSDYEESLRMNKKLNSEILSIKNALKEKNTIETQLKSVVTELECNKKDLFDETKQFNHLLIMYDEKLSKSKSELASAKESLLLAQNEVQTLTYDLALKNDEINVLNNNISGLKFGLVENSKMLKQILNETRFFGEVTVRIHDDINESFSRINSSVVMDDTELELNLSNEGSPFDPAVKWRDLQCEIINALKHQLECVYSAAKEKDILCNDLNIKINDLISEKRNELGSCENHESQIAELKKQIDDLSVSTVKLLAEKDETISALKEEISFLSVSEPGDVVELRLKIESLIEFNSDLEFKLNQAQLERDFFKEESELLSSLKNEIKEKDSLVLKLEQDIEMLEHEKNILDKRVAFLTKDAEDVKSLKIELSDIKHKFENMDNEEPCCTGDVEPLTDEEKLTRIKPEFLKNDLRTCFEEAIEQIIQQCDRKLQIYKEKVIKSEAHIEKLSADLWDASDKYLMVNEELLRLRGSLAKASTATKEGRLSLEGALHRLSFGCIGTGFDNLGCEELEKMDDVFPLNYQQRQLRNSKKHRRQNGLPKFSLMSGKVFPTEDEVEEIFNDNCLSDLKAGICNVQDPNGRYLSLPPSIFPYQDPEEKRLSCSRSLQGIDNRPKKEAGQTIYRRPGPPTPSKNAVRLSLSEAANLPSSSGLRDRVSSENSDERPRTPLAHIKIKNIFTSKSRQLSQDQQQSKQGGIKKKSGFFRRKKDRENISPT